MLVWNECGDLGGSASASAKSRPGPRRRRDACRREPAARRPRPRPALGIAPASRRDADFSVLPRISGLAGLALVSRSSRAPRLRIRVIPALTANGTRRMLALMPSPLPAALGAWRQKTRGIMKAGQTSHPAAALRFASCGRAASTQRSLAKLPTDHGAGVLRECSWKFRQGWAGSLS